MRKILLATIFASLVAFMPAVATAHAGHEAQGRTTWEKLQNNELQCQELTDEDLNKLGEYFMGQMTGDQHETMGTMMTQMMGEEGSEQMHITMGKRMSGCEPDATLAGNNGMMSMMSGGMMGGNSSMGGFGMMFMVLFMVLFWGLVIIGIVALVSWIMKRRMRNGDDAAARNTHKESSRNGKSTKG